MDINEMSGTQQQGYAIALAIASLALEWVQEPGINAAFQSWASRVHPEVASVGRTELSPGTLKEIDALLSLQSLSILAGQKLDEEGCEYGCMPVDHGEGQEEEPPVEDYDPGPECDDVGGMSEIPPLTFPDEPS